MPKKIDMDIRPYRSQDESEVVELWGKTVADPAPHNDPVVAIRMKMAKDPELFLVAVVNGAVVGTLMGGFDGHRGWLYALAVDPVHQRRGIATALVRRLEQLLKELGCLKINLQVRGTNSGVIGFYESVGYSVENIISMGKRVYEEEGKA
ncbi:MAG TPA: GNAT family acetyltransferase [Candidatus Hydrogenedentes bacterium]|nr:GNAT family acetyltransferase [Candidatus Hydrogenedentota bacterium]HIJ72678.1 GNAT family acetyltransferase [Candidatus Hydrogenedentota bacterium]